MKKQHKLSVEDITDEVDSLAAVLEDAGAEGIILDTGEMTIILPPELAKYVEDTGILGIA